MEKIKFEDVKNIYDYEKIRKEFRAKVIEEKKKRRVSVGDKITLVFENRDTVLFQIQEMARIERIVDDKMIKHEVETYNVLIPDKNELRATMLIEITERSQIKPVLDSLVGLNKGCLFLEFDGEKIEPVFDEGQFEDDRISAVQYLNFKFTPKQVEKFSDISNKVTITIMHKNYKAVGEINELLRKTLITDLQSR